LEVKFFNRFFGKELEMQSKISICCLIVLFVASCSQARLVQRSTDARQLHEGRRFNVCDTSATKNGDLEKKPASLQGDSLQFFAMASRRQAERDVPFVSRKKLVPFRERAQIFWTCVGACTLGGFAIGTVVGMAQEPKYHGEDSGWSTIAGMVYGTAVELASSSALLSPQKMTF
jgi:hypothetical protein